ncbi:MAG: vanadium-dependent haloperoxidase [Clostridium sp.]
MSFNNCTFNNFNNNQHCNCRPNKWSCIPYPYESKPYLGIDNTAGFWPLYYFYRKNNSFSTIYNETISFNIDNPCNTNFYKELELVEDVQANLTDKQKEIAIFFGTGVPLQQLTPILLKLISAYSITPPKAARLMCCVQNALNDAFVLAWHFKYLFDIPRPCQLNTDLITYLNTPKFPSYPSGHSVVSGAFEIVLSYFFPKEKDSLKTLAQTASISRLYGGIHFEYDLTQGLNLGRQIGSIIVDILKRERDSNNVLINMPFTNSISHNIFPEF